MGPAVWEFMWCIDKVTTIDAKGQGWVLGGMPIQLKHIAKGMVIGGEHVEGLGCSEDTISRNLNRLQDKGYLILIHAPYGISIRVLKAKKKFRKKRVNKSVDSAERSGKNAE